ncbi:MAG: tyrosine-type recombinase/integrase, partial [Burkholderiaceae bacterium]|nr:tyrosine-type recombinase/integrase [Burkholderiaceae bacterium]
GYYYERPRDTAGKRSLVPLGSDLAEAKKKWAELENRPAPVDMTTIEGVYTKYMEWAERRDQSKLSLRTISDRKKYWKQLKPVYGNTPINALLPGHIIPYFETRSSRVSGKKELKFLSVMCNWARGKGLMRVPNPCTGLFQQMKVEEGRDIYVEDIWLALVYKHGSPVIQDALDLAYLTGQRPSDVKKMRWSQIQNGVLMVGQDKTGAKLRIIIEGRLKEVLERIKQRGIKGLTILADPKGQPLKEFGYFRSQFDKARDAAEAEAREMGIDFVRFQFRDLRPKAATDLDTLHSLKAAQKLLGHTTERMTAEYIRKRRGDVVRPLPVKKAG